MRRHELKFLLYCLLRNTHNFACPHYGIKGRPIIFVQAHQIAAACSEYDDSEASVVDDIHCYVRLIESLHRTDPVIPMRYGTLFYSQEEIREVLLREQEKYSNLLDDVAGRDEMGIKIIFSNLDSPESARISPAGPETTADKTPVSGREYLAKRKALFARQESLDRLAENFLQDLSLRFSGLFSKAKAETSKPAYNLFSSQETLLSFYFLVPRKLLSEFVKTFEELKSESSHKMLLSGPWPPYNFVSAKISPATSEKIMNF